MARISFLSDKLMRSVGLNGKSVMPMISGFACAVPAIMSARNIENRKERLLTILVTPLMSCSARLPVYTTITALVIPNEYLFGVLSVQGLVLLAMYMAGVLLAWWCLMWLIFLLKSRRKVSLYWSCPHTDRLAGVICCPPCWERRKFLFSTRVK